MCGGGDGLELREDSQRPSSAQKRTPTAHSFSHQDEVFRSPRLVNLHLAEKPLLKPSRLTSTRPRRRVFSVTSVPSRSSSDQVILRCAAFAPVLSSSTSHRQFAHRRPSPPLRPLHRREDDPPLPHLGYDNTSPPRTPPMLRWLFNISAGVSRRLYRTILDRIRRFAAITPRAAPIWQ